MGVAPEVAIHHLFRMEHTLRAGSVAERAGMIANLMSHSGVTPDALANHLEGKPLPQQARQPQGDPRVDELLGHVRQAGQRRAEDANARAAEHLRAFEATQPEFLQDVADDLADLVLSERRKGRTVDAAALKGLYEKACLLNDDVRPILEQRKAEEAKRAQAQKVQQARHAGGSIQSQPAPPGGKRAGMAGLYEALAKNLG
jgi:DNA-directed RNA polymerase subunit F